MICDPLECNYILCPKRHQCPILLRHVYHHQNLSFQSLFNLIKEKVSNNRESSLLDRERNVYNYIYNENLYRQLNVTGTWITDWKIPFLNLYLTQVNNHVYGSYEFKDGKLSGILIDNTLEGTWTENGATGKFRIVFSSSGNFFQGTWGTGDDISSGGTWYGRRYEMPKVVVTGTWNTTFGVLTFTQIGSNVTGTIPSNNITINGQLIGYTLNGRWYQENTDGTSAVGGQLRFEFTDANTFKGVWGYNDSFTDGGLWIGVKITDTKAPLTEPINPFAKINVNGDWYTDFGKLNLIQDGNRVTGTYKFRNGTLTGTIVGNTITGTWTEVADSGTSKEPKGSFRFVFSPDGKSFKGSWGYGAKFYDGGQWNGEKIE